MRLVGDEAMNGGELATYLAASHLILLQHLSLSFKGGEWQNTVAPLVKMVT